MSYRLGFDIGGTFTDLVLLDTDTGNIYVNKVLTTPQHPEQAVLEGLRELLDEAGERLTLRSAPPHTQP